jgi:hypothetical protein
MVFSLRHSGSDPDLSDSDSTLSSQTSLRSEASDTIPVVVVLVVAVVFAASMLVEYAANPGELWHGLLQDRNVHFDAALQLAVAMQDFDVSTFLTLLLHPHIWPPAADLSLAVVMILDGMDLKLAILLDVVSWTCAAVLVF